jgi:restriction system protein
MSEIEYRLHWARTHLKAIGAVENSARGVWAITDKGQAISQEEMHAATKEWRARIRVRRLANRRQRATRCRTSPRSPHGRISSSPGPSSSHRPDSSGWPSASSVRPVSSTSPSPARAVTVVDGVGIYRLSLVSFPVYFQCKRYRGTVTAGAVRDFRGAMVGRGEKGLLITTGSFTKDAQNEANRDGAPPVELIDGERLCDLLKGYGLGVAVTQRVEEDIVVQPNFFSEYE